MGRAQLAGAPAADATARRFRLTSPVVCAVIGVVLLALFIAAVPLARLAHQSLDASNGSVPVWLSAAAAVVGLVLAWRKPGAVDLDSVRDDLAGTVHRALEPAHLSVWVSYRE